MFGGIKKWFSFLGPVTVPSPPPLPLNNKLVNRCYRKMSYVDAVKKNVVGLDVIKTIHDRTIHIKQWDNFIRENNKTEWWKQQYNMQYMKVQGNKCV